MMRSMQEAEPPLDAADVLRRYVIVSEYLNDQTPEGWARLTEDVALENGTGRLSGRSQS